MPVNKSAVTKYIAAVCAAVLLAVLLVYLCFFSQNEYTASNLLMNTTVTATVKSRNPQQDVKKTFDIISELENKNFSRTVEGSDIYNINQFASATVSPVTASYVSQTLEVCRESGGALDIGLGKLSDLWGVTGENPVMPEKEKVAALAGSKYQNIKIIDNRVSVTKDTRIDLGSVGKGAACDEVYKYLSSSSVQRAVVSVGGSVLLYGKGEFKVGVADPEKGSGDYIAVLTVGQGFVSTSGTYERYFELDGVRYHHILDPVSGYPVQNGLVSVTVTGNNGTLCDALSTACFVLGKDKGLELAKKYGCEAVFVTDKNEIFTSDNINLEITDSAFNVIK